MVGRGIHWLVRLFVLSLVFSSIANAQLKMVFAGVEGENKVYWDFSGCVTFENATLFGPLNDTSWLYPSEDTGWKFFSNDGTGDDLVIKSVNITLSGPQQYKWIIKDADGTILHTIVIPITGWAFFPSYQSIEPRMGPYTVPNLEMGQQLCIEGSGSFTLDYDFIMDVPNNIETALNHGYRDRLTNGGILRQMVRIIPSGQAEDYTAYQSSAFGGETDPSKIGPLADFDFDGSKNLLEFAIASDATVPDRQAFSAFWDDSSGVICIVFKMRANAPHLSYTIEYGQALMNMDTTQVLWDGQEVTLSNSSSPLTVVNVANPGTGILTVTMCYGAPEGVSLSFARLKVSEAN